jgi:hypothetical protein
MENNRVIYNNIKEDFNYINFFLNSEETSLINTSILKNINRWSKFRLINLNNNNFSFNYSLKKFNNINQFSQINENFFNVDLRFFI